jgi:hypothetical protein
MNRLQDLTLTENDARTLAGMIDSGNADSTASHAKTQEMLGELLRQQSTAGRTNVPLSFGGTESNQEYYNIFVVGDEEFDKGWFTVHKSKALTISIEPAVKKRFSNIRDNKVVEEILTLPSLFMSENADYMRSSPGQTALLGRVTKIKLLRNDVKFSFEGEVRLFQQSITDISEKLSMDCTPANSELNQTHWTIKQANLIQILNENGLLAATQARHTVTA